MAHMDRISMGDMYGRECTKYNSISKRARAGSRPRFTSSGDDETLCGNGSKRSYRNFCTRVRGLHAYV